MKVQVTGWMVDMDGVLADFEKRADQLMEGKLQELPKRAMWTAIKEHIKGGGRFWYELEKMAYVDEMMKLLVATGLPVEILTASGSEKSAHPDKRDWIEKHYPGTKVNIVFSSADKAKLAKPGLVLIDDRAKSIDPWTAAGSVGILHTDALSTMMRVVGLMGKPDHLMDMVLPLVDEALDAELA